MCVGPGTSDRTGVQLKDKWRNLVKFKHVSRVEADVAASKSATINSRCAFRVFLLVFCHCPAQVFLQLGRFEYPHLISKNFCVHCRRASGGSDRRYAQSCMPE